MSDALFKCPYCGQVFNGLKEDSGAEAECPSCGKVFTLEALYGVPKKLPNAFMCYIGIFKKYFGFKGRMRRREFWWAFFFWWVAYLVSSVVDFIIFREPNWCTGIIVLGTFIPFAAAQVRRLHDTNKSGWWIPLILLCPINIAYFVWLASDGDKGPNRFGSDPKEQ